MLSKDGIFFLFRLCFCWNLEVVDANVRLYEANVEYLGLKQTYIKKYLTLTRVKFDKIKNYKFTSFKMQ